MAMIDKDLLLDKIDRLLKLHSYAREDWFANTIHNTVWDAPEIETDGDLISRADAIEAVRNVMCNKIGSWYDIAVFAIEALSALPSADADRPKVVGIDYSPYRVQTTAPSAEAVQGVGRYENAMQKLREMPRYLNGVKAKQINKIPSEAVQGWIPCSERLPETHTEYVTENPWMQVSITEDTYQLSEPVLGYGKRKHHSNGDPMMSVVWYEDDGYGRTGWTTAPDCEDIDVIAWMPLPEPYKGGDDK